MINDLLTIAKSLEFKNEGAKKIAIQLLNDYEHSKAKKTLKAWVNCLLFVGQVYREDNSHITLLTACVTNPIRLNKEISKLEEKPENEAVTVAVRRGRKSKES